MDAEESYDCNYIRASSNNNSSKAHHKEFTKVVHTSQLLPSQAAVDQYMSKVILDRKAHFSRILSYNLRNCSRLKADDEVGIHILTK